MPYIGNVLTSFAVETGNINDQAVTAPKLSATGGTDGQILALDSNLNLEWVSDPAGQWVTSGSNIYYNDGNVGIGTSSPTNDLHVSSTSNVAARFESSTSAARIRFKDPNGDAFLGNVGDALAFYTSSSLTERLRITSSGRLGLGTSSPSYQFHVSNSSASGLGVFTRTSGASTYIEGAASSGTLGTVGSHPLNITTNSTTAITIDTSQRVGIATSSPGTKLDVNGAAKANYAIASGGLAAYASSTGGLYSYFASTAGHINAVTDNSGTAGTLIFATGSERMRVDSSGRVGIGTNSPGQLLHLSSASPRILLTQTSANSNAFLDAATSGVLEFSADDNNVAASSSMRFKVDGSESMRIDSSGNLLVGGTSDSTAKVKLTNATDGGSIYVRAPGNQPTWSAFRVINTSDSEANSAVIYSNGGAYFGNNVGINTTSPGSYDSSANNLVVGSASGDEGITIAAGTSSSSAINFADGTSGSAAYTGRILYQHSANALTFHTNGGGERMRIDSSGNLGVGTSSPSGKLHVNGTGIFESAITAKTYIQGHNSSLTFYGDSSAGSGDAMVLTSSGRLGIGVSSPATTLDVQDSIRVRKNASNLAKLEFQAASTRIEYSDSSGNLEFYTNSSRRAFVGYGGGFNVVSGGLNLTAGNITFSGADRSIINNDSNALAFGTNASERMRIDSPGRLLIGSTSSRANGYGDNAYLQLEGTSYPKAAISTILNSGNANGPSLNFAKSRGSNGGSTIVQSGDNLGVLNFAGADGTDIKSAGARIRVQVDGTPGSNDMPGRITFETTPDGSVSPAERMRIDSSGNIGIGEDSIEAPLHIGKTDSWIDVGPQSGNRAKFGFNSNKTYIGQSSSVGEIVFVKNNTRAGNPWSSGNELARLISGGGITFNGDTAQANALNDYEEGTWTPVFGSTSGSFGSVTYATQTGTYTKIGNRVFIDVRLRKSAHSIGTAGGYLVITGLPFQVASSAGAGGGSPAISNFNFPADVVNVSVEMRENTTQFYPALYTRDNATFSNLGPSTMNSGTAEVRATFSYYTNS